MLRLLQTLLAVLAHAEGDSIKSMPRYLRSAVLCLLVPLESATRRLIEIRALGMTVDLPPKRRAGSGSKRKKSGTCARVFALLDPRKRFRRKPSVTYAKVAPRITFIGYDDDPVFEPKKPKTSALKGVSAERIVARAEALKVALCDLTAQAHRLVRLRAIRARQAAEGKPVRFFSVRRPGRPPGFRARSIHPVDEWLKDLDRQVLYAATLPEP